ncbi:unnamed protein product, partial [Didymodactylos carnosus]
MIHADGIQMITTKPKKFYVVTGTILELPPPLREYARNKLLLVNYLSENEPTPLLLYDRLYIDPQPSHSHHSYLTAAAEADRNQNQMSVFGVHGKSPLLSLFIDVQENCPFDYMHLCCSAIEPLLDEYRKDISVVYGDDKLQLYSLHAHKYLPQQVLSHGALFAHGCFGDESFLGTLKKSRKGNIRIPHQIFKSYLLRDSQQDEEHTTATTDSLFVDEKIYDNSYLNLNVHQDYFAEFKNLHQIQFNQIINTDFSLYCRFLRGIVKFNSLLYSRMGSQLTNIVSFKSTQCLVNKAKCFAIVIWYFEQQCINYAFIKRLTCMDDVIRTKRTDQVGHIAHAFIDRFYSVVDMNSFDFSIIRVGQILHQCVVIPFFDLYLFSEVLFAYTCGGQVFDGELTTVGPKTLCDKLMKKLNGHSTDYLYSSLPEEEDDEDDENDYLLGGKGTQ